MLISRPEANEYAPFYAGYVAAVPAQTHVLDVLGQHSTAQWLARLSEAQGDFAYAPGKWTVKEVIGHLIDTERIFAYRALCLYRGDASPLPSFDQDVYLAAAQFHKRSLASLAQEFAAVRTANLLMLEHFDQPERLVFAGNVAGGTATPRALVYMMAGHELHHLRILAERYAPGLGL